MATRKKTAVKKEMVGNTRKATVGGPKGNADFMRGWAKYKADQKKKQKK